MHNDVILNKPKHSTDFFFHRSISFIQLYTDRQTDIANADYFKVITYRKKRFEKK